MQFLCTHTFLPHQCMHSLYRFGVTLRAAFFHDNMYMTVVFCLLWYLTTTYVVHQLTWQNSKQSTCNQKCIINLGFKILLLILDYGTSIYSILWQVCMWSPYPVGCMREITLVSTAGFGDYACKHYVYVVWLTKTSGLRNYITRDVVDCDITMGHDIAIGKYDATIHTNVYD